MAAAAEEAAGRRRCAGYRHGPPWVFKGRQGRDLPLCPAAVRIDRCARRRRSPGQRVTLLAVVVVVGEQRAVPAAFGEGVDGARLRAPGPAPRRGLRLHARRHVPRALPRQPRRRLRRGTPPPILTCRALLAAGFGWVHRLSPLLRLQLVVIAGIVWNPPTSCA